MIQDFKTNFNIKTTNREISSHPGFAYLVKTAHKLGVIKSLQQQLKQSGNAQKYSSSVHILSLAALLASGGSSVSDIEAFRKDKGLLKLLGMESLPAENTLEEWLRSDSKKKIAILQNEVTRLSAREVKRRNLKEIILDPDATLFERYKSTCKRTYKGFKGYAPMVVTEAITRTVWHTEFRAGNVSPAAGALEILKKSLTKVPDDVKVNLRADSAWYQHEVMDHCQDNGVAFSITANKDAAVMAAISNINDDAWCELPDDDWSEITETVHSLSKSKYAYRLLVLRKKRNEPQPYLFDDYYYYAIITNREGSPAEILHFHRGRGSDEQINDELKNGYEAKHVPCIDEDANAVFWQIACLALNLVECSKAGMPASWRSFRIKKLRFRLFNVAVLVVRTGRKIIMRVGKCWTWRVEMLEIWRWCLLE